MLLGLKKTLSTRNFISSESMRFKHNLNKSVRKRRELNPGINLQTKLLKDTDLEELDLEELETDFMNLNTTHRDHVRQLEQLKEREKYLIIKQKYFKERTPNFLTWTDKMQIRHLHNTDPELWTVEKLSEGFPALPEVIAKIIKGNWMKKSSRIKNHDTIVASNWNSFKKGQMTDLPPHLVEHLNKFTGRKLNLSLLDIPEDEKSSSEYSNLVQGEFSEIIASYERVKDKTKPSSENDHCNEERKPKKETYLDHSSKSHDSKYTNHVTLNQLQKELEDDIAKDDGDQFLLQKLQENSPRFENHFIEVDDAKDHSKTGQLSAHKQEKKNYDHLVYPEKITIPKNRYKRGHTYKLNDCYYDSDGLFLYRVPGMDK